MKMYAQNIASARSRSAVHRIAAESRSVFLTVSVISIGFRLPVRGQPAQHLAKLLKLFDNRPFLAVFSAFCRRLDLSFGRNCGKSSLWFSLDADAASFSSKTAIFMAASTIVSYSDADYPQLRPQEGRLGGKTKNMRIFAFPLERDSCYWRR